MPRTRRDFNWGLPDANGQTPEQWLKEHHTRFGGDHSNESAAAYLSTAQGHNITPDGVRLKSYSLGPATHATPSISGLTADVKLLDGQDVWDALISQQTRWERKVAYQRDNSLTYPKGTGAVGLALFGDLHIGGTCLYREMRDDAIAARDAGCACVLLGDYLNNWVVGKLVSQQQTESVAHEAALSAFAWWLEQVGPSLCVCVGGNHDNWSQLVGLDYVRPYAAKVNPKVLYDPNEVYFRLRVGNCEKRILARHKWRGYSKFNPTHGIEQAATGRKPFEIGVGGHIHNSTVMREFCAGDDQRPRLAAQVATYKRDDDYQQSGGWPEPYGTGAGLIVVEEDGYMLGFSDLRKGIAHLESRRKAWKGV